LNWVRNSNDKYVATLDNCNTALRFAYFHGKEFFNKLRNEIYEAMFDFGKDRKFNLYTWSYLDRVFNENGSFREIEELEVNMNVAQSDRNIAQMDGGAAEATQPSDGHVKNMPDTVGVTTMQNNINFVEQMGVGMSDVQPVSHSQLGDTVPEEPWTAARMLERPMRLARFQWTTAQADLTTLLRAYPWGELGTNQIFNNILSSYQFVRGTMVMRVEVNGHRFAQGKLISYAVPMTFFPTIDKWHALNKAAQTSVQHKFSDACDNSVIELELPFYYNKSYYNYNYQQPYTSTGIFEMLQPWSFYIQVFNPLLVGTGASNSLGVTVWFYLKDVELKVPYYTAQGDLGLEINLKGWDRIIERFLPKNIFKDAFDVLMGRDKPNDTINPTSFVQKPVGYMSNSKNVDRVERLALDPSYQDEPKPDHFGTKIDEMDMKYLTGKYSYIGTTTLSTSMTAGSILNAFSIDPIFISTNTIQSGATTQVPLLTYLSLPFSYWRGAIKFRFDVVGTSFHTAKLAFYIRYGSFAAPQAESLDPMSVYTTMFELNAEKKTFEFEVPYFADTAWRRVQNGSAIDTTAGPLNQGQVAYQKDWYIGYCGLSIVNPLVAPSNVATSIAINGFIAGGDDFELAYIGANNTGVYPARGTTGIKPVVTPPADEPVEEEIAVAQGDDGSLMAGPKVTRKGPVLHSMDACRHLKDVMKRHYNVMMESFNSDVSNPSAKMQPIANLVNGYNSNPGNLTPSRYPNGLSYWTALFRSYRGGWRIKRTVNEYSVAVPTTYNNNVRKGISWSPEPLLGSGVILKAGGTISTYVNPSSPAQPNQIFDGNTLVSSPTGTPSVSQPVVPMYRGGMLWSLEHLDNKNEFEIPWEQCNVSTLTSLDANAEVTGFYAGTDPGLYGIYSQATNHGVLIRYSDAEAFTDYDQFTMAAADDFRMGGFMGVPFICYAAHYTALAPWPVNIAPAFNDSWLITA
jgi:hypothetical protein